MLVVKGHITWKGTPLTSMSHFVIQAQRGSVQMLLPKQVTSQKQLCQARVRGLEILFLPDILEISSDV